MGFKKIINGLRNDQGKKVVIFPGQNSQYLGMGADIPADILEYLFEQTKQALGEDLSSYLFFLISPQAIALQEEEKIKHQIRLNQNCQLTTFITSCGLYLKHQEEVSVPDFVSGHSLGMYAALFAAKVAPFSQLVKIVKYRQSSMNDAALLFNGGMSAVIGDAGKISEKVFKKTNVKIGNFNTPNQTVITGLKEELEIVGLRLKKKGFKVVPLRSVLLANHHSEYMELAKINLEYIFGLPDIVAKTPEINLVLDTTGKTESDPHKIRAAMIKQPVSQIHWRSVMEFFIKQKILKESIVEIGPGRVLTKMKEDFPGFERLRQKAADATADELFITESKRAQF